MFSKFNRPCRVFQPPLPLLPRSPSRVPSAWFVDESQSSPPSQDSTTSTPHLSPCQVNRIWSLIRKVATNSNQRYSGKQKVIWPYRANQWPLVDETPVSSVPTSFVYSLVFNTSHGFLPSAGRPGRGQSSSSSCSWDNEEPLILTEAPLRFVLKVFSVLRRGRARSKLLGPNCSSEFHHFDGAFGETIHPHCFQMKKHWMKPLCNHQYINISWPALFNNETLQSSYNARCYTFGNSIYH